MLKSNQVGRLTSAILLCGLSASCVSQDQYSQAVDLAQIYQDSNHDLEAQLAAMRGEMDRLESEGRVREADWLRSGGAGSGTDYEARISQLQEQLEGLGRAPQDIERFDVDGGYVYMIQDKVLFASGSADVASAGNSALVELARKISAEPHGRVFVRGHTDSDPVKKASTLKRFPHGNLQLSSARSVAVAAVLTGDGHMPGGDVVVMGFGRWDPVADNGTAEGKKLNRRVEIFVADPSASR
ncbi:MAG: flagellar motor protein MotB [Planctomycetota bacterium]|jgi:flagellar motor protein MotB